MKSILRTTEGRNTEGAGFSSTGKATGVQPKLSISQPNNQQEQEAKRVADNVANNSGSNFIQHKLNASAGEHNSIESVSPSIADTILSSQGKGMNLDYSTNSFMSSRFGADFSNVKIHNGSQSTQLNEQLNAKAFTVGNNIYFNEGKYAPTSEAGKHLLAHELTHTVQQSAAPVALQKEEKGDKTFAPKPEIDFKLLPPDLQIRVYHFLLEADTSKVQLDYHTKTFMAGLSYSYGDALSLKLKFNDFTGKLGWTPGSNAFSLGAAGGGFSAGITAQPGQSKYGLSLGYGAPLLPMPGQMTSTFMAGGTSAGNMLTGLPGVVDDPMAWYQQYKPDIENITKTADMVKQITGDGKSKIRFGANFSLTYDPVSQLVIGGKAGIMF